MDMSSETQDNFTEQDPELLMARLVKRIHLEMTNDKLRSLYARFEQRYAQDYPSDTFTGTEQECELLSRQVPRLVSRNQLEMENICLRKLYDRLQKDAEKQ
jgi:hypothetical protein